MESYTSRHATASAFDYLSFHRASRCDPTQACDLQFDFVNVRLGFRLTISCVSAGPREAVPATGALTNQQRRDTRRDKSPGDRALRVLLTPMRWNQHQDYSKHASIFLIPQ